MNNNIFKNEPFMYNFKDNIFAKEKFNKFFINEMIKKPNYFKLPRLNLIYEAFSFEKRKIYYVKLNLNFIFVCFLK